MSAAARAGQPSRGGMAEVAGIIHVCVTLEADGPDDTVGAVSSARLAS